MANINMEVENNALAKIKVIGVGGGGNNAISRMRGWPFWSRIYCIKYRPSNFK